MSKNTLAPSLHIEWTPQWVRVINVATGDVASGESLTALASRLSGHSRVIVGVGRSSVFLKTVRLPKARPEDLRKLLDIQLGQMFPLPSSQLSFDFIQSATDQTPEGLLTMVAAIRSEDLRRIRDDLRQVGITPERVLPIALGSVAVAAHGHRHDAVVTETTPTALGLDVIRNGMLQYSRVAPEGGSVEAEVQRTLTAAQAGRLPVISVGLVEIEGAETSVHSTLSLLAEAPAFDFELTEDRIVAAKAHVASRTRTALLFLAAAIMCVVLVTADRVDQVNAVDQANGQWSHWLATHKSIVDYETDRASDIIAVQNNLKLAYSPGQQLSDIENVVTDNLPAGAWLTGITIARGKPMQVRGTARSGDDVAKFVNAIGNNARFRDVKLVFANSATIGTVPVVQFSVTATCVGNLPMPAPALSKSAGGSSNTSTASSAAAATATGASS